MTESPMFRTAELLLESARRVLNQTLRIARTCDVGDEVVIAGHVGDPARVVDIAATNQMRRAVCAVFGDEVRFEAEDTARSGRPLTESLVWVGDALDGTRQRSDLGFGYGCAGSLHGRVPDGHGWQLLVAGVVNSSGTFAGTALGVSADSLDLGARRESESIVVAASRPADIELVAALAHCATGAQRVWNIAGNPAVPQLVASGTGLLVQPRPQAQWDALSIPILASSGFSIWRLDVGSMGEAEVDAITIQQWFARPDLETRSPIPPFVAGTDNRQAGLVWEVCREWIAGRAA